MINKNFIIIILIILVGVFFAYNFSCAEYGLEKFEDESMGIVETERSGVEVVTGIINVLLGIIGVILVALIVYGGIIYATSLGNEERVGMAKRVLTYSFIGILIIASSFAITTYVVPALFGDEDGGNGTTADGDSGDGDGDAATGTGSADYLRGASMIDEGDQMIDEGEALIERGEAMLADDDEDNDDDGQELINDGRAMVEEGRDRRTEGSAIQSRASRGTTRETDIDIDAEGEDCLIEGEECNSWSGFMWTEGCCGGMECEDGGLFSTGECR